MAQPRHLEVAVSPATVLDWTIVIYLAGTAIVAALLARDTRTHRHDRED